MGKSSSSRPRHSRCLTGKCRKCGIPIKYKKQPLCINCSINWGMGKEKKKQAKKKRW